MPSRVWSGAVIFVTLSARHLDTFLKADEENPERDIRHADTSTSLTDVFVVLQQYAVSATIGVGFHSSVRQKIGYRFGAAAASETVSPRLRFFHV